MSHFTVLVIGDNIEGKLAPYNEQLEVEEYEIDCHCGYYKASRSAHEQARDELGFDNFDDFWAAARGNELEEKYRKRADELLEADPNKGEPNPECIECDGTGRKMSIYNPKSKWDWYQIGGRWTGLLPLKPEALGKGWVGEPTLLFEEGDVNRIKREAAEKVSQASFGDIDWDRLQQASPEELEHMNQFWDWVEGKISEEGARERHIFTLFRKGYYLERYKTREEYIRRGTLFSTWVVVTADGEWHEKGKMGFWAMSDETHEEAEDWDNHYFDRFLKNLEPDTLITIVDCHI